MGSAWHDVSALGRPAARWGGLLACALAVACGGDREASPDGGTGSVATADSASPSAAATTARSDTAAGSAPADTVKPARDTAAMKRAAPVATKPTKPAATSTPKAKPAAKPAQKPAAQPAAAPETSTSAAAQDTGSAAAAPQDNAAQAQPDQPTAEQPAAAQETTATAQDTPQAAQETGTQTLRDAYHQAPRDTVDQATYNGWKQYNLNCARCHGEDVLGSTIAPHLVMSLKPDGPIPTQEAFIQVLCAGRPEKGMPSWCALGMEPAKMNEIYAYVKGRSEGKLSPGRPALREGS